LLLEDLSFTRCIRSAEARLWWVFGRYRIRSGLGFHNANILVDALSVVDRVFLVRELLNHGVNGWAEWVGRAARLGCLPSYLLVFSLNVSVFF